MQLALSWFGHAAIMVELLMQGLVVTNTVNLVYQKPADVVFTWTYTWSPHQSLKTQ